LANNTPKQRAKQTKFYQEMTELLHKHKARLEGEILTARNMLKDNFIRNDRQARTLLKVATLQLKIVKNQIKNDHTENIQALRRKEINKFW